jgi:hypothetical protein
MQDTVNDYGNPFLRVGARLHLMQSGTVTIRFRAVGPPRVVNMNENAAAAGDVPEDAVPMASDVRGDEAGGDCRRSRCLRTSWHVSKKIGGGLFMQAVMLRSTLSFRVELQTKPVPSDCESLIWVGNCSYHSRIGALDGPTVFSPLNIF